VRLLLVDLADAPAGREVDCGYWREGARELEPAHPTLARKRPAPGKRLDSAGVLARMARAVRAKLYFIRTEQSYADFPPTELPQSPATTGLADDFGFHAGGYIVTCRSSRICSCSGVGVLF